MIDRLQRHVGQEAAAFLLPVFRLHDARHDTPAGVRGLNVVDQGQEIVAQASGATEKRTSPAAARHSCQSTTGSRFSLPAKLSVSRGSMPPTARHRRVGHRLTAIVAGVIEFAIGAAITVVDRAPLRPRCPTTLTFSGLLPSASEEQVRCNRGLC